VPWFAPKSLIPLAVWTVAVALLVQCGGDRNFDKSQQTNGGAAGDGETTQGGTSARGGGQSDGGSAGNDRGGGSSANGGNDADEGGQASVTNCVAPERECAGECIAEGECCAADCPAGASCVDGACTCPSDTHECDSACVANDSVDHCGSACTACPTLTGGSASCDGRACGASCPSGQKPCAGVCIAEDEACTGMCPSGSHDCGGLCGLDTAVTSCGTSCDPCAVPPNSDATCSNGKCGFACKANYKKCNSGCVADTGCCASTECKTPPAATCADSNTLRTYSGGTCSSGTCTYTKTDKTCSYGCMNAACQPLRPTQISIGSTRICALMSNGHVWCWGSGPLGDGGDSSSSSTKPLEVKGISTAVQVAAGAYTPCVLLADHTIRCWGNDDYGQITGMGFATSGYDTPFSVSGVVGASDLISTGWTTCALLSNGTVRCWGSSDGTSSGNPTAVRTISSLSGVTQITGGVSALLSNKSVKYWVGASGTPTTQTGLPANITRVDGTCALSSDGSVRCWGSGAQGQIGNGLTDDQTTPQLVQQLGKATWIGHGNHHVCAILTDQSFSCWGKDGFFDPIDYGPFPLPISGLGKVSSAAVGYDNTCVIETNDTVKCWGSNLVGQLGDNGPTVGSNSATPVVIAGLPTGT